MSRERERSSTPRTSTAPERADLVDTVAGPRFTRFFSAMLLEQIPPGDRTQVLVVGCGTGRTAFDLLGRLGPSGRLVALDADSGLIDVARRRGFEQDGRRLFFKVQAAETLAFDDGVFDVVACDLDRVADPERALRETRRVLSANGRLLATVALDGTFVEVLDMFSELALARDDAALATRLETHARRRPSAATLPAVVRRAGFADVSVRRHPFKLPFRSARELFADPLVDLVGLPEWRAIAGNDPELLAEVERRLDVYAGGSPLSLTVEAALVIAHGS